MTKRVLILVLSTDKPPYGGLFRTSVDTWDSQEVEGVETLFYFARPDFNPAYHIAATEQQNGKALFTSSDDDFWSMGKKTLAAFEYALVQREFDFIFRANASLYCDKAGLLNYAQDKPTGNLALGVVADCGVSKGERFSFLWGPGFMLSRDVVQKLVANQAYWDHTLTDDNAISRLLTQLEIPLDNRGSMASVAKSERGYEFVYYENGVSGGASMQSLDTLREQLPGQFCFRVKCDADRSQDLRLMRELQEVFAVDKPKRVG